MPIKPLKFFAISTFARFPSIISSTIAGSSLVEGNWTAIIMTYILTFTLAGVIIYIFNKRQKVKIEL